jgi:cysteine desulfurase
VGALYVRHGTLLLPVLVGADHEHGLRPGTENVPLLAGLGEAARLVAERLPGAQVHMQDMRDRLHQALLAEIPGLILNGHAEQRLPNTLNVSFPGASGKALLATVMEDVAASTGSACHAGDSAASGVLGAMGASPERAMGAVRLSVGWPTTAAEIDQAARALTNAWKGLRG